jgi:hypothetical protein
VTRAPFFAGLLAGAVGFGAKTTSGGGLPPILVLALGIGIVFSVYACALLMMGQEKMYIDLLRELFSKTHSKS